MLDFFPVGQGLTGIAAMLDFFPVGQGLTGIAAMLDFFPVGQGLTGIAFEAKTGRAREITAVTTDSLRTIERILGTLLTSIKN
jgi:hypothetical protein